MPGQFGGEMYKMYKAEMMKIVSQSRHDQLMEIDQVYAETANKLANHDYENMAEKSILIKKLKKIADEYGMDWKLSKIPGNRDKMIISCLPMVLSLAQKYLSYARGHIHLEDLVQAGNLGLIIGVDRVLNTPVDKRAKYDKIKFSSYVYPWVKKYIMEEAFQNTGFSGTVRDKDSANRYATIVLQKQENDGEEYSNDIWDVDKKIMKSNDFKDLIAVEDEYKKFQNASKKLFNILSKNEKTILFMAYGIDTPNNIIYNQSEIAEKFGKPRVTINRMLKNIMWKLKHSTKNIVSGEELIASFCLIQGLDMSKFEADNWKM